MKTSSPGACAMLDGLILPGGSQLFGYSLVIRNGAAPTFAGNAPTGGTLASCSMLGTFPNSVPSGSNALATMTAVGGLCFQDLSANGTGTAGYWRLEDGSAAAIMQGTVGAGSGELSLNTLAIVTGQVVNITAFAVSLSGLV